LILQKKNIFEDVTITIMFNTFRFVGCKSDLFFSFFWYKRGA